MPSQPINQVPGGNKVPFDTALLFTVNAEGHLSTHYKGHKVTFNPTHNTVSVFNGERSIFQGGYAKNYRRLTPFLEEASSFLRSLQLEHQPSKNRRYTSIELISKDLSGKKEAVVRLVDDLGEIHTKTIDSDVLLKLYHLMDEAIHYSLSNQTVDGTETASKKTNSKNDGHSTLKAKAHKETKQTSDALFVHPKTMVKRRTQEAIHQTQKEMAKRNRDRAEKADEARKREEIKSDYLSELNEKEGIKKSNIKKS